MNFRVVINKNLYYVSSDNLDFLKTFDHKIYRYAIQSIRKNDFKKVLFYHANYEYDLLYMRTKAFTRKT